MTERTVQKEKIYNKLLPYAKDLDEESQSMLEIIKTNLGLSIVMHEIRPGCDIWTAKLKKYILLYGLKFSKEEHINFIYLMYELILIPHLEPNLFGEFINILMTLLKKKKLISPAELILPWRPLYNLCKSILFSSRVSLGMYGYSLLLQKEFVSLILAARFYFPISSTVEMLDEWKPMLCPFDVRAVQPTIQLMSYFLPIITTPGSDAKGYDLWLEDLMNFWKICNNNNGWECYLMELISVLAQNNIGCIDWEPHIPLMFSRFLKCFQLPVSFKQNQETDYRRLSISAIALWIVSILGGGSTAQDHLTAFLRALDTYFHPSNMGKWSKFLVKLLEELTVNFVERVHFERYTNFTWQNPVPNTKKLTESDIEKFVQSMKFVVMQAMFSSMKSAINITMQYLAMLKPALIIPDVIESFYFHMEEKLKPHHFRASLQCMTAVLRPMLESGYKEGPSYVIPLLMAVLQGIDPNDHEKTMDTLNFIGTMASLIPIVDCSQAPTYYDTLTKEEEALCLATSSFIDFISQFLDQCFALIASSSLECIHLDQKTIGESKQENLILGSVWTTCSIVFHQTSLEIFQVGLDKLYRFVVENVLETKVAGQLIAGICHSFACVHVDVTLQKFVPYLGHNILSNINADSALEDDSLSVELLYNLQLLSEIVYCRGDCLLPYISLLEKVLDKSLKLTCREGFMMALNLLQGILESLVSIVALEYRCVPHSFDEHISQYLPIKDWGKLGDIDSLNVQFFVPGDKEIKCFKSIVDKYLPLQMKYIQNTIGNPVSVTNDKLEFSLEIIRVLLDTRSLFKTCFDSPEHLVDSFLRDNFFYSDDQQQQMVKGTYIAVCDTSTRSALVDLLGKLQSKLVLQKEKNTKSLSVLIGIWDILLSDKFNKYIFAANWFLYHSQKRCSGHKLLGRKRHVRPLLISRVLLQHELLLGRDTITFTSFHKHIALNLLELSTSQYVNIREEAQSALSDALTIFPYLHTILISTISENLKKDAILEHYVFEGATQFILEPKIHPIVIRHDWIVLQLLWPSLIRVKAEKPSIINSLKTVTKVVEQKLGTITINLDLSDQCVNYGVKLCKSASHEVLKEHIDQGRQMMVLKSHHNLEQYLSLLELISKLIEEENRHNQYNCMAMNFLMALIHPDNLYPPQIVKCFLNCLINDSIAVRKLAIKAVIRVFKQQKKTRKKVTLDPFSITGKLHKTSKIYPGDRPDNQWVKYKNNELPRKVEQWNKMYFSHREYHGYYCWPHELILYAPAKEQPILSVMNPSSLKVEESEVYTFFSNSNNIQKLIQFLAMEEKKGEDKFSEDRFLFFKGLFRNSGTTFLKTFLPDLKRLVCSPQECCQRCAAEIVSGMIRGSKHWPYDMLQDMWNSLAPLIKSALQYINQETISDWKKCFMLASRNRDPRWNYRLFDVLLNYPDQTNTFLQVGMQSCVESVLRSHLWRMSEVLTLWFLKLKLRLSYQFENLRMKVGEGLSCIFEADVTFPGGNPPNSPHISDFVDYVIPMIKTLYNVNSMDISESDQKFKKKKKQKTNTTDSKEYNSNILAVRILKTVCVWISTMTTKSVFGISPDVYKLVPLICLMENSDADSELVNLCDTVLRKMAQAIHESSIISSALSAMRRTYDCKSWKANVVCLKFLQVFVFYNMPVILHSAEGTNEVINIVLKLIEENSLEVREKAAQVLCDLLHTGFIKEELELLSYFKNKLGFRSGKKCIIQGPGSLNMHHAAVLGLCAFINAYPYQVPDFVPDLFSVLQNHLSDPLPIPQSIRKTLSDFQRTHHDKWSQNRLKFSEEQLSILEDTISPSYYA